MPSQLQDIQSGGVPYTMSIQQIIGGLKGTIDISEIVAFPQIRPPSTPVTLTTAGSGDLNGTYQYKVAFVTGFWTIDNTTQLGTLIQSGNTGGGATASITVSNESVLVSNIPIGPNGTVARVIYRTKAGGNTFYQVAIIYNNQQTTYTDNTPDSSLTVQMPTTNTTGTKFVGDGSGLYNLPLPTIQGGTGITTTMSGTTETISLNPAGATLGGVTLPPSAGSPTTPVVVYQAVSTYDMKLTSTSATTVLSYTPAAEGQFKVSGYLRVANAATSVTVTLTYTSPSGSQTITLVPTYSLAVGDYTITATTFEATTSSAITLTATAGTANNQALCSCSQ